MKKTASLFLAILLCFVNFRFIIYAKEETEPVVKAKSAVLMDADTRQVLYSFNENEKLYPASVTKIMPLLLFMQALDEGKITLDEKVKTTPEAASKGGSQIWLKEGEKMSVNDLLKATAIGSANDACTSLGIHIASSEEAFVKMMNDKARELGMKNTNFVNCSGLDDDTTEHLTTAYDIALMSAELLRYEKIRDYTTVWMDSLRDGETQLVNTNRLVRFYKGTTGLKTGTTSKAGHCLSASAQRDGLHLVAVVMGAENSTDRFEGAKSMLNWGFANFETVTPEVDTSLITQVRVLNGVERYITPKITGVKSVTLRKDEKGKLKTETELTADVKAPVEENQVLGKVVLSCDERVVGEYKLIAESRVEKLTVGIMLLRMLKSMTKAAE